MRCRHLHGATKRALLHSHDVEHALHVLRIGNAGCSLDNGTKNVEVGIAVLPALPRRIGWFVLRHIHHVAGHSRIVRNASGLPPS